MVHYLSRPNRDEVLAFRRKRLEARYVEKDGLLLTLVCPEGTTLVSELPYDPTLRRLAPDPLLDTDDLGGMRLLMTMLLIDPARDGEVKVLRTMSTPKPLARAWTASWSQALGDPGYSARYNRFLDRQKLVPILSLWEMATRAGRFGE